MRHPRTGEPGFWVPKPTFVILQDAMYRLPELETALKAREEDSQMLQRALVLMTRTATAAEAETVLWEQRHDVLYEETVTLRLELANSGDPFWLRLITATFGGLLVAGGVARTR